MAKAKLNEPLPYYRWYWRDWRGSRAVQRMTPLERGIYRELLDEQWKSGALRNDVDWLAEAAMCSAEEMANVWRTLSVCFPPIQGSGGELLANERLEAERTEQDTKRAKSAIAGRLGGLVKQSEANAKRTLSERHIAVAEQSKSSSHVADATSSGQAGDCPDGAPPCPPSDEHEDWREALRLAENGVRFPRIQNPE